MFVYESIGNGQPCVNKRTRAIAARRSTTWCFLVHLIVPKLGLTVIKIVDNNTEDHLSKNVMAGWQGWGRQRQKTGRQGAGRPTKTERIAQLIQPLDFMDPGLRYHS